MARHRDDLGQLAQVLGGGSEDKLVFCTVWSPQAQAVELKDAFEVREEHLDLLSLASRGHVGIAGGDIAGHVARAFVDRAQDLALGSVRTAFRSELAGVARRLARTVFVKAIDWRLLLGRATGMPVAPQLFAARAGIGQIICNSASAAPSGPANMPS
jgi:hypothetical protein